MALFHFTVTQTKRSKGQSAIASAAYRSGEKLYSEYYGEYSDYTRKRGVICSDILLPPHVPKEYADRQTLWNAVEKAERGKTAQLAYSFEISLQNEFSLEENIALAREFLFREFVSRGMTVDVSFHEKECEDGGTPNPQKVNSSGMITYHSNQYSVPPEYMGKHLSLQVYDNCLHLYDNTNLVAMHEISSKKMNYLEQHYIAVSSLTLKNRNCDIAAIAKENLKQIGALYQHE